MSVSILPLLEKEKIHINEKDFEIKTTRGSGKGGQHRNKVETAVIVKHIPTGLVVRCESERSQLQNKETAFKIIYSKINKIKELNDNEKLISNKNIQRGTGNRPDKDRVYIEKRGEVVDYKHNIRFSLSDYLKGKWSWI